MTCCGKVRPGNVREGAGFARPYDGTQSGGLSHARRFDELLRGVVQDTASAAPCAVDIEQVRLHAGCPLGGQRHFVEHRTRVIRQLETRIVDAVEFPQHLHEICLPSE